MSRGALSIHQSHSLADGDYASETHSVMKPNPAILQILPHYGHESGGLSRADIARCIAAHNPVLDVDQVAAERCFLRLEFYAHGQRFNGTTPRIVVGGITTHHAHAGDGTGRLHALRNGAHHAHLSFSAALSRYGVFAASSAVCPSSSSRGRSAAPSITVSYTHLRAHETDSYLVCRLLLEKKKKQQQQKNYLTHK